MIRFLLSGGFSDGYRDPVFRMTKTLPVFRGIVGPWCHDWPDCNRPGKKGYFRPWPVNKNVAMYSVFGLCAYCFKTGNEMLLCNSGPHIEYMLLCKEWWDQHLKQTSTDAMDTPLLRVYLQDMIPPSAIPTDIRKGRWVEMNKYQTGHEKVLLPDGNGKLLFDLGEKPNMEETTQKSFFSAVCGLVTGEWCSFGDDCDPGDQKLADAHSLCWTSDELQDDINILGNPQLECLLSADKDQASIAVRLVDVFPDGKSTLITFGVLNLTHRRGHAAEDVKALVPDEKYKVKVELRAISYVVPKGHRIRLAVSPSYFPMMWPSRENVTLEITTGGKLDGIETRLSLPIYPLDTISSEDESIMNMTESPQLGPTLPSNVLRVPKYKRYSVNGLAEPVHKFVVDGDNGRVHLLQTDTIMDSHIVSTCSIEEGKPLSAVTSIEGYMKIEYPNIDDGIRTCADLSSKLWSDYENFYTDSTISISLNDDVIHRKTWKKTIPRFFV